MTVSTLRPNATTLLVNASVDGGAPSAHAALSDNTDSTWVRLTGGSGLVDVWFPVPTLPAGSVASSAVLRVRAGSVSGYTRMGSVLSIADNDDASRVMGVYATATIEHAPRQPITGAPQMWARLQALDGGDCHVFEAYLDYRHAVKPVVTVSGPTGTITTTNRPTLVWSSVLDADGGARTHYEVKVFSAAQYGAVGFDAATSVATDGSGVVASQAQERQVTAVLADASYRAYVRVAQTVNGVLHWSDWDYEAFVVDVDRPAVPGFTLAAQSSAARIRLNLFDAAGVATTTGHELQRASLDHRVNLAANPRAKFNTAGWDDEPVYFVNPATVAQGVHGASPLPTDDGTISEYFVVTCSGTNPNEGVATKLLDAMEVGQRYRVWMYAHRENSTQNLEMVLGAAVAGRNATAPVVVPAGLVWERYAISYTATSSDPLYFAIRQPSATARIFSFTLVLAVEVGDDSVLRYFDGDTPLHHWTGAAHASPSEFGEWLPVRSIQGDDGVLVATNTTVTDYEAPNGQVARYRARALHDYGSGSYAASGWVKATATWESEQWWLKHPNRPDLNLPIEVFSYANVERAARRGVLQPLGARLPVVVSDTRAGATGTVVVQARTTTEQAALDALLDTTAVLLLQGPPDHGEPDRYVSLGDASAVRVIDNGLFHLKRTTLPWVETARPPGALSGEYVAPAASGEELVIA